MCVSAFVNAIKLGKLAFMRESIREGKHAREYAKG